MDTQITTVTQAFPDSKQYAIPSYQRNYVWTQQGQWEPLWEDVKVLADRWFDDGQAIEPHFLGTIITKQIGTRRFVNRWWIVDGQQRLTTLQILLAAARDAFVDADLDSFASILANCLVNSEAVARSPEDKFKMDPKSADYRGFASIIERGPANGKSVTEDSSLSACYSFFYRVVREWLDCKPIDDIDLHANAFSMAIREKLQVVDIRLGKSDNPHTIFEALNARGEP